MERSNLVFKLNNHKMTINEAQKTVDNWIKTVGVRYFDELTNLGVLMEEVGEVARLMTRLYGEQSFKSEQLAENAKHNLKEELGDVLFVLLCIANQTDTDLESVLQSIIDKRSIRDKDRHKNNPKLS